MGGRHEISISAQDLKSVEMFSLAVKLRVIGIFGFWRFANFSTKFVLFKEIEKNLKHIKFKLMAFSNGLIHKQDGTLIEHFLR